MLSTLTLLLATTASLTAAACTSASPSASGACYTSTTTVLNPTCVPWTGICPLMICATPTATATAVVPLVTPVCEREDIPVVTKFRGCTTDCGPITCPTLTVTSTATGEVGCCAA